MTETGRKDACSRFIDPERIRRVVAETNTKMGSVLDPTSTAQEARELTEA